MVIFTDLKLRVKDVYNVLGSVCSIHCFLFGPVCDLKTYMIMKNQLGNRVASFKASGS